MSLSPQQVKQVADLARLQIAPQQVDAYAQQLSSILGLVDQLAGAPTQGVTPMAHPLEMTQRLRADEVTESDRREIYQAGAPAVQDGLYLVPKVIE